MKKQKVENKKMNIKMNMMNMKMKMKMKIMKIKTKMMMKQQIKTKKKNDLLDEIIDKSKSFEDQLESLKKVENLDDYYYGDDFDDKELKYKYFKIKLAYLSNEIDKKLFE